MYIVNAGLLFEEIDVLSEQSYRILYMSFVNKTLSEVQQNKMSDLWYRVLDVHSKNG